MANDTITKMQVYSIRVGQAYEVKHFREYAIDMDLETDSDQFHVVFDNPDGKYTGIISKFDPIIIYVNDEPVLHGTVDEVEYNGSESESVIQVIGRDLLSILVDNDALPCTQYNVKPDVYIRNKLGEYGITKCVLDEGIPTQEKLIIGTGESEISVMGNLIVEDQRRLWLIYDTVYMGKWNTSASPSYRFTRGVPQDQTGMPIKTISLRDNGGDLRSEYRIYGSTDDGDNKVLGTAENQALVGLGVRKRRTLRSSNNDSSTKYASSALEHIRDDFRSGIELTITTKTRETGAILPSRTAQVIDYDTRLNSTFFIRAVRYEKNMQSGSITTITMVPDDSTFSVLWSITSSNKKQNSNITGTPDMTLAQLLANKK